MGEGGGASTLCGRTGRSLMHLPMHGGPSQLQQLDRTGPLLFSPGGGVSPGTPIENLQALLQVLA